MAKSFKPRRVYFRDASGRFLPETERYSSKVKSVSFWRGPYAGYVTSKIAKPTPTHLAQLLTRQEFEALHEALVTVKTLKPRSKYAAWDIAKQIDQTPRLRRKQLKFTMTLMDGKAQRVIEFYHQVKRNAESSYSIFRRINQEVGFAGFQLYDKVGTKIIADRKGKHVKLVSMKIEEVI